MNVRSSHLVGRSLPDCALQSTDGDCVRLAKLPGRVVVFVYPYTGKHGIPDPPGWDDIKGAHGSTPQAHGFSKLYPEFAKLGVKVFGLSFQDTEWQRDFVARNMLAFPLLSDIGSQFSNGLPLETFKAGDQDFLTRRTVVAHDGVITLDFYPVPNPAQNAVEVLKALQP